MSIKPPSQPQPLVSKTEIKNMTAKPFHRKAFILLSKILLLTAAWNKAFFRRKFSSCQASALRRNLFPEDHQESLASKSLMFHTEGAILRSTSLFPYFFLVAFEAGGPLRALLLLLLYPLVCLAGSDMGMKIMVFVCFVGLKQKDFRVGTSVLPKFFLEDVGSEAFEMVMKFGSRTGVSDMPRVMVESFLRGYLGVDEVVGRELKVVCGHFSGLMEGKHTGCASSFDIGLIGCFSSTPNQNLLSSCKAMYLVSEADKKTWEILPREKYLKPLTFHDGRVAFRPTPLASLLMFMWIPMGLLLVVIRSAVGLSLPYKLSIPIFCFTGATGTAIMSSSFHKSANQGGRIYVCNHRTLLDPIYLSMALMKPVTAATYSLSRITELFAPIKTIRLTRNREEDARKIGKLLSQGGELAICPEGTTCREPYLLRFSPLFAEMGQDIVPVAMDFQVSMFYGTTASGHKFLDPVFVFMNPTAHCSVKILEKVPDCWSCHGGGKSKFEVANYVQERIAEALGFECTSLTRKDKYLILAGNEGRV